MSGPYSVGTRVAARFQASWKRAGPMGTARTKWYPGCIASAPYADGCCDIRYDDGDFEARVQPKFIRGMSWGSSPAASSPAATTSMEPVGERKANRTASTTCLELHLPLLLQLLIDSMESGFGNKRHANMYRLIPGASPFHMTWGLLCKLSKISSAWQAAVHALRLGLSTVHAGMLYERHLDDTAVRVLARDCPNLRIVHLYQCGSASEWHASRHPRCASGSGPGRCVNEYGRGWDGKNKTCRPPVGDAAIQELLLACPLLQQLSFVGEWRIGASVLFTAARHCAQLTSADLHCCAWVPSRCELGDDAYASACSTSSVTMNGGRYLFNYYASHLTAASLISFFTGCTQLTELNVEHLPCLDDEVVQSMSMLLPKLRALRLGGREGNCRLTERAMASTWPSLTKLDIRANFLEHKLTALETLSCPRLEALTWLPLARGLERLASAAPQLKRLKLVFYPEDAEGLEGESEDYDDEEFWMARPPLSAWLAELKHTELRCLSHLMTSDELLMTSLIIFLMTCLMTCLMYVPSGGSQVP